MLRCLGLLGLVTLVSFSARAADQGEAITIDGLKSTAPATWKKEEPSAQTKIFRKYQFRVPRAAGDTEDAEAVVFFFGEGGGGGVEENIKPLEGLVPGPGRRQCQDGNHLARSGAVNVTQIDITGTYKPTMPPNAPEKAGFRMMSAIFASPKGPYYFRLLGPEKDRRGEQDGLRRLAEELQMSGPSRGGRTALPRGAAIRDAFSMPFLDYELPPELIAQEPSAERDRSRLLVVRRSSGTLEHRQFFDLPELLAPGDLIVLNDTRVLPARLIGHRECTGGKWEGLYLGTADDGAWEMLCQLRGRLREGETILVEPALRLTYLGRTPGGHFRFRPETPGSAAELLTRFGHVPLPPYIRKGRAEDADNERYQTVYARRVGAVAAPTAGLHFTEHVFAGLSGSRHSDDHVDPARRPRYVSADANRRPGEARHAS